MKQLPAILAAVMLAACTPPEARQAEDAEPMPADATAPEPAPVDARALARDTLTFLDTVAGNMTAGVKASDVTGIDNEVEAPAFRLVQRWTEVPLPESEAFSGCRDGANAAMILAGDITSGEDTLSRRKSIDSGAAEFDRQITLCRDQVGEQP